MREEAASCCMLRVGTLAGTEHLTRAVYGGHVTWSLHIANASGRLDGLVSPIRVAIYSAKARAEAVTEPVDLDVVIQAWPGRVIAHLGHAGYAPTDDMIKLTFDPANPNCAQNPGELLERTIVHELHHVLRWRGRATVALSVKPSSPRVWRVTSFDNSMAVHRRSGRRHLVQKPSRMLRKTQRPRGTMRLTTTPHGFWVSPRMAGLRPRICLGRASPRRASNGDTCSTNPCRSRQISRSPWIDS